MDSFFSIYSATLRQILTDGEWWLFIFQLLKSSVFNPFSLAGLLLLSACAVLVGYYYLMRSMHKSYWIRPSLIVLCTLCALLTGSGIVMTLAVRQLPAQMTSLMNPWLRVMRNPDCWPTHPFEDALTALRKEVPSTVIIKNAPPAGSETSGSSCWQVSLPLKNGKDLSPEAQKQFETAAQAAIAPAIQAFREDFPLISCFFSPDPAPIQDALIRDSIQYWEKELSTGQKNSVEKIRPHIYSESTIGIILDGIKQQSIPVLRDTGVSLCLHLLLLSLLSSLIGAVAVILDCRWKLKHPETEK